MLKKIFWSYYTLVAAIAVIAGLSIGVIINDFPNIKFDSQLKLYEVLNLLLTVCIALSVPFVIKKWIDDKRVSKNYIIDEVKEIVSCLSQIRALVKDSYYSGKIDRNQKDLLLQHFHELEIAIGTLNEQLKTSFPAASKNLIADLKSAYFKYDHFITGDELMRDQYTKIDNEFYRLFKTEHLIVMNGFKLAVHKITCY